MAAQSLEIALERFSTFGDLLKFLRRRAGLTQRELSIAVGYSDAQISRLEQNERLPDVATISARFLPVLMLDDQPEVAKRLLELAENIRREDAPAFGLPPYKGLFYFDESDSELFFGREKLTALLAERIFSGLKTDHRFLTVIGASGSGKSSLVRAGLIPALRWRKESSGWTVHVLTPTEHPLIALSEIIIGDNPLEQSVSSMVKSLNNSTRFLKKSLEQMAENSGAEYTLLVIDQFEELFTLCKNKNEQELFIDNVLNSALLPDGKTIVVIALRADFYAHCAQFDQLRQAISCFQEYIGPMSLSGLKRAIEEPAKQGHWELEPGLIDVLLHDIGADVARSPEPGALPLLSHALLETWQRRRGHTLTISGYIASGGIRGAIAETAETVFHDKLDKNQRIIARQIFLRLTELGGDDSTADTRRRVSFDELVSNQEDRDSVREVLVKLADVRLITTDQDMAEVAHEALIREWPTLRNWLEEDREGLRLHRHLTMTALEWDSSNRDPSILYRGARLAQVSEWAADHESELNFLEHSFLDESKALLEKELAERERQYQRELEAARRLAETEKKRAEEQIQSNQRLQQRAVFLAIAFVLAGILAVFVGVFWRNSVKSNKLAISRELSGAAINNINIDPERSTLLALQAINTYDTLEARNALHQSIPEMHLLMNIPASPGGVPDISYSPDGKLIASMAVKQEVKLWDSVSGELLNTLFGADEFGSSLAFSPDGSILAAAYFTQVVLWDLKSGTVIGSLSGQPIDDAIGYNLGVGKICFSSDGNFLAISNMDGLPTIWDIKELKKVMSLETGMLPSKAIAYSADDKLIATGGDEGIIQVWNSKNGIEIYSFELGGIIHSLSFSSDGKFLAAASEDGGIRVWNVGTGETVSNPPRQSGMYDISFLSDGRYATANQDGTTRIWDPLTGQQLLLLAGPTSTVISVDGSPDGQRIATGAYDGSVRIWDTSPGKEIMTIPAHEGIVWNIIQSPDGKRLYSASVDGKINVWDSSSGVFLNSFSDGNTITDGFTSLAISPDGSKLASGNIAGTISIWDSYDGNIVARLKGHENMVVGLAFSPDGNRIASAGWDGTARVWNLTNQETITFRGHDPTTLISNIVFSPDGSTVFTGADDKIIYQWDVLTGQVVHSFSTDEKEIYGLAVSPDGHILAASDQDGNIHLWNLLTREKVNTITGHAGLAFRLVFNQDGSLLASAGFDRLAKVWEVQKGVELFSLYGNASNVFGVAFSPDGKTLATAGADGTIRIYALHLEDLIEIAESRLTRSLSPQECEKFIHTAACPK